MPVYLERMPAGFPGRVSRKSNVTLEPVTLGADMSFGAPGKIVNGELVPMADSDAANVIYGFLACQYPNQSAINEAGAGFGPKGALQSVMRRGYMTVRIVGGAPAKNAPVYVVTKATAGVVGSLSASAGTGLAAIPGCTFMGEADGGGNVEISFNI